MGNSGRKLFYIIGFVMIVCVFPFLSKGFTNIKDGRVIDQVIPLRPSSIHAPILISSDNELDIFCAGNGTDGLTPETAHIIEDFTISGSIGLSCINITSTTRYLIIRNCTLTGAGDSGSGGAQAGICLALCSNVNITGCLVYGNIGVNNLTFGITLVYVSNIVVSNNIISYNSFHGVSSHMGSDVVIINNEITNNLYSGISITNSSNTLIKNNIIKRNPNKGIVIGYLSDDCTVIKNDIEENTNGIEIDECFNVSITNNKIHRNSDYGVKIWPSTVSNDIYYNTITDNGISNAIDNGIVNYWDNGSVGNYWGDYESKYPDASKNGDIWDTPYEINGTSGSMDNYPLVHPIDYINQGGIDWIAVIGVVAGVTGVVVAICIYMYVYRGRQRPKGKRMIERKLDDRPAPKLKKIVKGRKEVPAPQVYTFEPIKILKVRYALGEIDDEEFLRRKKLLLE